MSSLDGQTRYWQPLTIDGVTVSDNLSADYLRVDGSNSMQATLDLGGHNAAGSPFATAAGELVPLDQLQAELTGYVTTNTVQSITAQKTFTVSPLIPDGTTAAQAASYGQTIHTTGANQTINTGTLSVNEGAAATIIPAITAANGTNTLNFIGRASAGSYGSTTQADDALIWFTKGASETGCLSIIPHASGTKGIRITPTTVKIYSPLSVANQLISDVANAVAGTDAVNLNTLNSTLSQYALDSNVIHKTGYSSETKQGQLICTYPTTGPQILTFAPFIASCQSSEIYLLPNSNPNNANPAIVSGDQAIIATGGSYDTGNIWIGVQSTNTNGLRMTPTSAKFYRTLDMNSTKITSLANGSASSDAATVGQLAAYLPLTGGTMSGQINMGSQKITSLANGTVSTDAATLGQVTTALGSYLPLAGGTMSGQINMGSQKITSLANGTASNDAVNVSQIAGFALDSAVVHNTGNETIGGIKTFSSAPVVPNATVAGNPVNLGQLQTLIYGNVGYFFAPLRFYTSVPPFSTNALYTVQAATVQPNTGASGTSTLAEDNYHVFAIQLTVGDVIHGVTCFQTAVSSPIIYQFGLFDSTGSALFSGTHQMLTDLSPQASTAYYTGTRPIRCLFTDQAAPVSNPITYTVPSSGIYIVALLLIGSGGGTPAFPTYTQVDPYSTCFSSTDVCRYSGKVPYVSGPFGTTLPTSGYTPNAGVLFVMID